MDREFRVRLTPEDDKIRFSENLLMPAHLKKELIVGLALMHKHGIVKVLLFLPETQVSFLNRNLTEN